MKKILLIIVLFTATFSIAACSSPEKTDSHIHDDGSAHMDHGSDTITVEQEEFKVDSAQTESVGQHSHDNGEKHAH